MKDIFITSLFILYFRITSTTISYFSQSIEFYCSSTTFSEFCSGRRKYSINYITCIYAPRSHNTQPNHQIWFHPQPKERRSFCQPGKIPAGKSVPEFDNSLPNIPPSQPGPYRSGGRNIMSSCVGDFFHEEIQHSALRPNKSVNLFRLINRIICDDNQVFPPPALMARGLFRSICPPFEGCCRLSASYPPPSSIPSGIKRMLFI